MRKHRHAQIARHAAIVLAGAASLSLTVVAGAYIVQQIAETDRPGTGTATPAAQTAEDAAIDTVRWDPVLTGGSFELPAVFTWRPAAVPAPAPKPADPQTDSTVARNALGGKLHLGNAYLGAELAAERANTVSLTVDTNALTVLTGGLRDEHGDSAGVTQLRTQFDTRSGEVVLMLTDPTLGAHDLRIDRRPAPGVKSAPETKPVPQTWSAPETKPAPAPAVETTQAPAESTTATQPSDDHVGVEPSIAV